MQLCTKPNIDTLQYQIKRSIDCRKALVFMYTKRDSLYPGQRTVVFREMYEYNGHRYAKGYCLTRLDMRTFRLDRIDKVIGFNVREVPNTFKTENDDHDVDQVGSFNDPIEYLCVEANTVPDANRTLQKVDVPASKKRRGVVIFLLFCAVILSTLLTYHFSRPHGFRSHHAQITSTGSLRYMKVKGTSHVTQKPVQLALFSYRGFTVHKAGGGFTVEELEKSFETLFDLVIAVNAAVFIRETGIYDYRLMARYIAADSNSDGALTWSEIKLFQRRLITDFVYRDNERALRPDEFLEEGGGDCEDFALFTSGLLLFWNYDTRIGILDTGESSHAVTLVYVDALPNRFKGYFIDSVLHSQDSGFIRGYYTVIDYDKVGGFTKASGRKAELIGILQPGECYGRVM